MQARPVVPQPTAPLHQPAPTPVHGRPGQPPRQGPNLAQAISVKLVAAVIAYFLMFVGFVLQLGGVGSEHEDCRDLRSSEHCEDVYRSFWWATFFQILVGIGTALVLLVGILDAVRVVVAFFLGISTIQLIRAAEDSLDEDKEGGPRTAAAGYMFSTMANFVLILVVGVSAKPVVKLPGSQPKTQENQPTTQERVAALQPQPQEPHYLQSQTPPPVSSHPPRDMD